MRRAGSIFLDSSVANSSITKANFVGTMGSSAFDRTSPEAHAIAMTAFEAIGVSKISRTSSLERHGIPG